MRVGKIAGALGALALLAAPINAQTVTYQSGTVYSSPGLTGFQTWGQDMVGMDIFWTYVGGGGGSAVWGDLGGGQHGVSSGGFSLSLGSSTDTFTGSFLLSNLTSLAILSMTMSGANGFTIFDCTWINSACFGPGNPGGDTDGTPSSARGWTAQTTGGTYAGPVSVIYTNAVGIGGNAPVGDLFETLIFTFGTGGIADGQTYAFRADTDNSLFDQPPPTPIDDGVVPEPATMVLVATGLAGLALVQRRRKKQQH